MKRTLTLGIMAMVGALSACTGETSLGDLDAGGGGSAAGGSGGSDECPSPRQPNSPCATEGQKCGYPSPGCALTEWCRCTQGAWLCELTGCVDGGKGGSMPDAASPDQDSATHPAASCSPCRAMNHEECFADLGCRAVNWWGETDTPCDSDDRGFGNCETGCMQAEVKCATQEELINTCPGACASGNYQVDANGCHVCGCGGSLAGPVLPCANQALCEQNPKASACGECSPCRAMTLDECKADLRCRGIEYWGESFAMCDFDDRGFATNCPVLGCQQATMDKVCPAVSELNQNCSIKCSYNSYPLGADGCRYCGACGDGVSSPPVSQCAKDALQQEKGASN
jgi:hypothetical protein